MRLLASSYIVTITKKFSTYSRTEVLVFIGTKVLLVQNVHIIFLASVVEVASGFWLVDQQNVCKNC